ncbi:MAG: pyridoxamine 5'-phosphate oxidase family protein [Clostridia bacterium]|nr:pyridoxamine 5'-phosphate oxidase family protein [Clostridia bacterium]
MKRVYEFLKKAEVYYLATVDGDQPRVRPFGTINEFEGKLYIQTGKVKPTSRQLAANPKAEITAFCAGEWVRVACELVEDDRVEAKKAMLDAYPNLRGMYDENDGNTQVFYMQNVTASFCAFGKAPETVTF